MRAISMLPGPQGYTILFLWVFAEQIGLPIPAAPALLAAGALAVGGHLHLLPALIVTLTACVLADGLWYRAGSLKNQTPWERWPSGTILRVADDPLGAGASSRGLSDSGMRNISTCAGIGPAKSC